MTAQELLGILLQIQDSGIDLSSLDVVTLHAIYDEEGASDIVESYPAKARLKDSELLLTH